MREHKAMASNYKETLMSVYKAAVQLENLMKEHSVFKSKSLCDKVGEIQMRLTGKKFRVAVVGEFNRGKSSLINVLLGKRILPEDVLATTATINRVTYGEHPKAYLIMKDNNTKTEDIPVEDLVSYVTKLTESSAQKAAEISEAVVEYPTMLCYNDIDLIDTPGMNDMDDMNAVTVNKLEDIDLAVVVVNATLPFSETERNFVVKLLESPAICQIVFVVSYIDRLRPSERERLLSFLSERIVENVFEGLQKDHKPEDRIFQKYHTIFDNIKMYAVSSLEGMDALESGDMELYEKSGYLRFTRELPDIFLNSRSVMLTENASAALLEIMDEYKYQLNVQYCTYEAWEVDIEILFENHDIVGKLHGISQRIKEGNTKTDRRRPYADTSDPKDQKPDFSHKTPEEAIVSIIDYVRLSAMGLEKSVSHNLLKSLEEIRQADAVSVGEAMLPVMQSEFSRVRIIYRELVKEACKDISKHMKRMMLELYAAWDKRMKWYPGLYTMLGGVVRDFFDRVDELEFGTDIPGGDDTFFFWVQSPVDIVLNTGEGQSVLPELSYVVGESLAEANKRMNQRLQHFFDKATVMLSELVKGLKEEMLSRIIALQNTETIKETIYKRLDEMGGLCKEITNNHSKEEM